MCSICFDHEAGQSKVPLRIAYVIWEFLTSSTYFFKARTATFFSLSIEKIRNEKYFCPSWGFRNNVKNFYRWWICTASLLQLCAYQFGWSLFQNSIHSSEIDDTSYANSAWEIICLICVQKKKKKKEKQARKGFRPPSAM